MYRPTLVFSIVALITMFGISCSSFKNIADIQNEYKIEKIPSATDWPDQDGVVVLYQTDVQMDFGTNYDLNTTETVHVIKRLFKNINEYATVEIPVYFGEKILNVSARTIRADGTVIPLKRNDIYTIHGSGDDAVLYSDEKRVRFTFAGIEPDGYIEYTYVKYIDHPFITGGWYIQQSLPILRNIYRLGVPNILFKHDWNWNYRVYNYDLPQPEVLKPLIGQGQQVQEKVFFTWTIKDVSAYKTEPMMSAPYAFRGYVKFAPTDWKTWNDITQWYYNKSFIPRMIISEPVSALSKALTKDAASDEDKINKLYEYVRNLRYVAVELEAGNIVPQLPQTVLDRQYGDCKDKSNLLIAMLRNVGINAKPVLVLTANNGFIDPTFPSWRFNHMIVKAECGKKTYWLDPTADFYPAGALPWVCSDIQVLVINYDGTSQIENTTGTTFKENTIHTKIDMNISEKEFSTARVNIQYQGIENYEHQYILQGRSQEDINKFCKSLIIDQFLESSIDSVHVQLPDSSNNFNLNMNFFFATKGMLTPQGDLYLLSADPFKLISDMRWLIKDKRQFPLSFKYPKTIFKSYKIKYPDNMKIRNLPKTMNISDQNFRFYSAYSADSSNQILLTQEFSIKNPTIIPDDYKSSKQFFEKIQQHFNEKIILNTK